MWDQVWVNCHLATMDADLSLPYGSIKDAAIACKDGKICFVGPLGSLPGPQHTLAKSIIDLEGRWVTPGLIDCHTHLVFSGNRAAEFEQRQNGKSYEEIARKGGGINSTVTTTRAATQDDLVTSATVRLHALISEGVTTVEIKSGYGLSLEHELKMLKAAKTLGDENPVTISKTFLGAHALPPEFKNDRAGYIAAVCDDMIPEIARLKLADAVDAFCENIGFTLDESQSVLAAAKAHGLPIKLHAEQLSDSKGAKMAASMGALSVDHLEYLNEDDVPTLKKHDTVAVLLPGAFYFLKETKLPPIAALRSEKVPIALATDCNPGSSPIASPLTVMNMGATLFGLTPEETLAGFTKHAATALGLSNQIGQLKVGLNADLAIWNIDHPAELTYWQGINLLHSRVHLGDSSNSAKIF